MKNLRINARMGIMLSVSLAVAAMLAVAGFTAVARLRAIHETDYYRILRPANFQQEFTFALQDIQAQLSGYTPGGDHAEFERRIRNDLALLEKAMRENTEYHNNVTEAMQREAAAAVNSFHTMTIIVLAAGILILIFVTVSVARSLTKPAAQMTETLRGMIKGNLKTPAPADAHSEWGVLENTLADLSRMILKFKDDTAAATKKHETGDTDAMLNEKAYEGAFRELALEINAIVTMYNHDMTGITDAANNIGQGDFNARVPGFTGKKARYAQKIENLRENMKTALESLLSSARSLSEGKASSSPGIRLGGEWAQGINEMNGLLDTLHRTLKEAANILNKAAQGDFTQTLSGDYKGDSAALKLALNTAVANMADYIRDISAYLTELAGDKTSHTRREYTGPFPAVRDAFRAMESRVAQLEKHNTHSAPHTAPAIKPRIIPEVRKPAAPLHTAKGPTAHAPAKPREKDGGFTAAVPTVKSRTLVAPNASHIYDSKDFGKYR
jgi:methyl-accepting chemotaxis protein